MKGMKHFLQIILDASTALTEINKTCLGIKILEYFNIRTLLLMECMIKGIVKMGMQTNIWP